MPDERGAVELECVEQAVHVSDQFAHTIVGDLRRGRGQAIAALVRGDRTKTGVCEGRQLVPPGIGEFRKAVQENDRFAFTLLVDSHVQAIGPDESGFGKHALI